MKSFITSIVTCVTFFSMQSVWSDQTETTSPYVVEQLDTKYIVGVEVRTTSHPSEAENDIPLLWEEFYQNGGIEQIPGRINDVIIALYVDYKRDYSQPYTLVIGTEVSSCNVVPEGLVCKEIPASSYAVFQVEGEFPESVMKTWQRVWETPIERTYTGDMEVYPADFDPETNSDAEIFIAIE